MILTNTDLTNKRVNAWFCRFILGVTPEEIKKMAEELPGSAMRSFFSWFKVIKESAEEHKKDGS